MRSSTPFFETTSATGAIDRIATCSDPLLVYCGAGVTIDRTGHSWAALIRSCFPGYHSKKYPSGPRQDEIARAPALAPEQLASSLIHTLREIAKGSKQSLQDTLRERIRRSLYGNKASWQAGELSSNIVQLAFFRSIANRRTTILTTNYDDHIEHRYRELRADVELLPNLPIPGLRVKVLSPKESVVLELPPVGLPVDSPNSFVTIVYLHGRVPRRGSVNWPIVLDENSYAATAGRVGRTLRRALREHPLSLIVGSSLQDLPLVRALSRTRTVGTRLAVLTKAGLVGDLRRDGESLGLDLVRHRCRELFVEPIFADFHGQVAQLFNEFSIRTAFRSPDGRYPWTADYMNRLAHWWDGWVAVKGVDATLPTQLADALRDALPLFGIAPNDDPLSRASEGYRLELWVRAMPASADRQLVRWATSENRSLDGVKGKRGNLETPSYLAPVRAFTEGRPRAFDIKDLEAGRESTSRYTSKAFLAIPIRVNGCIVGVLSLASTNHLAQARMLRANVATANTVDYLKNVGATLLDV